MANNLDSRLSFEEWCAELNEFSSAEPERYGPNAIHTCGAEAWRGYFDDDYSPADAWQEDGTYA